MPTWLLSLLGGEGGIVQTIASFIPNPAEAAKAAADLQGKIITAFLQADADQREINKVEAASPSMFVAGWRPAVGWLCVSTLAWTWTVAPILTWVLVVCHVNMPTPLPQLSNDEAQTLLYALLGVGGFRTVEKLGGVETLKTAGTGLIAKLTKGIQK